MTKLAFTWKSNISSSHQKAPALRRDRFVQHENWIVNINCAQRTLGICLMRSPPPPLCLGFDFQGRCFHATSSPLLGHQFEFCDGQQDESVQEVPRYRPEPVTSSFIGFCESPSQTLDQTTSISSKKKKTRAGVGGPPPTKGQLLSKTLAVKL